jgi:hypothetical protein
MQNMYLKFYLRPLIFFADTTLVNSIVVNNVLIWIHMDFKNPDLKNLIILESLRDILDSSRFYHTSTESNKTH